MSLLNNFIIICRRLLLLYMSMFIFEMAWLQIIVFLILNLIMLNFLVIVRPYKERLNNNLNIFNSAISILVVYFIMQINGPSYYLEHKLLIGQFIGNTIYLSWIVNGIIILTAAFFELKHKILLKYDNWKRRKVLLKRKKETRHKR